MPDLHELIGDLHVHVPGYLHVAHAQSAALVRVFVILTHGQVKDSAVEVAVGQVLHEPKAVGAPPLRLVEAVVRLLPQSDGVPVVVGPLGYDPLLRQTADPCLPRRIHATVHGQHEVAEVVADHPDRLVVVQSAEQPERVGQDPVRLLDVAAVERGVSVAHDLVQSLERLEDLGRLRRSALLRPRRRGPNPVKGDVLRDRIPVDVPRHSQESDHGGRDARGHPARNEHDHHGREYDQR
mmetsp:Transcript_39266/g.80058  ORF Transcript_39266/g.80058 Transcript_39266/m.80058 type:complete len:238 (-) Transcript_39266:380-1093(-)